jgi:hypothetical protein
MPLDDRLREGLRQDVEHVLPDTERRMRAIRRRGEPRSGSIGWLAAAAAAVAIVAILVIGLRPAGVSVRPGSSPGPTVRPTPGLSSSHEGIAGTAWSVELLDTDPGVAESDMAGSWTLRLGGDSIAEVSPPDGFTPPDGAARITGAYAITGDLVATNLFTRGFGAACTGSGDYRYSLTGGLLVLAGRDTCLVRHALLTTRAWAPSASEAP